MTEQISTAFTSMRPANDLSRFPKHWALPLSNVLRRDDKETILQSIENEFPRYCGVDRNRLSGECEQRSVRSKAKLPKPYHTSESRGRHLGSSRARRSHIFWWGKGPSRKVCSGHLYKIPIWVQGCCLGNLNDLLSKITIHLPRVFGVEVKWWFCYFLKHMGCDDWVPSRTIVKQLATMAVSMFPSLDGFPLRIFSPVTLLWANVTKLSVAYKVLRSWISKLVGCWHSDARHFYLQFQSYSSCQD